MVELVKRGSYFLFVKVDHLGVAHHEVVVLQQGQAALHLARHPEVVLVGKDDDVACGRFEGMLKVAHIAVVGGVVHDTYLRQFQRLYHVECVVGRAVVYNYVIVLRAG